MKVGIGYTDLSRNIHPLSLKLSLLIGFPDRRKFQLEQLKTNKSFINSDAITSWKILIYLFLMKTKGHIT